MSNERLVELTAIACACIGGAITVAADSSPQTLRVAKRGGPPITIVAAEPAHAAKAGQYLRDWLIERGYEAGMSDDGSKHVGGTIISLGLDPGLMDDAARPDAHSLSAKDAAGETQIRIVGKTSAGIMAGVYRLIEKLANSGDELRVESGIEQQSPFIRIRLACLAPTGRRQIASGNPFKDADLETWTSERLRAYPELFAQFGFSGIQVMEIRGYASIKGADLERARKAVTALMVGAKSQGLFVSLDQWGDCPDVEGKALCWEVPEERAQLEAFWRELAARYGPYTDHVYVHVGDPGGATHGGCSKFVTPQKLTAAVLKMFREQNANVQITMSTWANPDFWKHAAKPVSLANYDPFFSDAAKGTPFGQPVPDGATFLDETWMPKEVGIALHREYNKDQADLLVAVGRPVDVWAWYIADMEMLTNLTLNMSTVDRHYRDLPDEAGQRIRIQTAELTFHGWPSILSTYVAGRKMWDPRRPLEEIEREFCVAAFGPVNADAMLALYQACENPWDYDVWSKPMETIPRLPDIGTPEGNVRMERVLAQAATVKFPVDWKPNFAFPVPAQRYVDMLTARLRLTLAYSRAKLAVDTVRKDAQATGKSKEEIERLVAETKKRAIETLPTQPIDPLCGQDDKAIIDPYRMKSWAGLINGL
jgi:hypothetical protein